MKRSYRRTRGVRHATLFDIRASARESGAALALVTGAWLATRSWPPTPEDLGIIAQVTVDNAEHWRRTWAGLLSDADIYEWTDALISHHDVAMFGIAAALRGAS